MFLEELRGRILVLDGAMGTMIQGLSLEEQDFRGTVFASCRAELKGDNECLNLTRPDAILDIHRQYIAAGADIITANSFGANRISQGEYGLGGYAARMAHAAASIARRAADESSRRVWVAGDLGPTGKSLSIASGSDDPAWRECSFDEMEDSYAEEIEALVRGGADILLIETCFDALNAKAAIRAAARLGVDVPLWVSVSVADKSRRVLTGQSVEAFYRSVEDAGVSVFGLNCSLGAVELTPMVEELASYAGCPVSCHPNAGLPDEMGHYNDTPSHMASVLRRMGERGLLNIAGGCCGTTPDHIRAIADALRGVQPRPGVAAALASTDVSSGAEASADGLGGVAAPDSDGQDCAAQHAEASDISSAGAIESSGANGADAVAHRGSPLYVSGLDVVAIGRESSNFTNIGERTNVAGSRKFARLIAAHDYNAALGVARQQIDDGASVIDVNMDDAMLDSTAEMRGFLRCISNEPSVARVPIMIDSSHWETVVEGLKNAQGKCIVNSISLKEGEEAFLSKARTIRSFGAAMVIMAFDEEGQATDYERKVGICRRAYRLLTREAGVKPQDIIFDVNVLSVGTGLPEHRRYAVDFIEAVRWIKANLPGAKCSGGISNLSFAFRGNNPVREAMHSVFLYHAVEAGLDMGIVNPGMLRVYDDIEPELRERVEDVILDRREDATERLIAKAREMADVPDRGGVEARGGVSKESRSVEERLADALVRGGSESLKADILECLASKGRAVDVIEGPLMDGMRRVGEYFGEGKMFLPQVVKSARVMREAVEILQPYMEDAGEGAGSGRPKIVIATVKGDVHDIGKNITATVLRCNGFDVTDLGVMVPKERILEEAERTKADIIAVSGLITPSLYQMEELCREMSARGMSTPLFVGGATTSALHTAVKLAPLYGHVYYGADASASAVLCKSYMKDPANFEMREHEEQAHMRSLYVRGREMRSAAPARQPFDIDSYLRGRVFDDIPEGEADVGELMRHFDWRMFYAVWGIKVEDPDLRRDAQRLIDSMSKDGAIHVRLALHFEECCADAQDEIVLPDGTRLPMLRQEDGDRLSLADFVPPQDSGHTSQCGFFAVSVRTDGDDLSDAGTAAGSAVSAKGEQGRWQSVGADDYGRMLLRSVRVTLAEAASALVDSRLAAQLPAGSTARIVKPAAGYYSCPDHTLKRDILSLIPDSERLGISFTDSYAMIPDASICTLVFAHPQACYPDIRHVSREALERYAELRGFTPDEARKFLGHLAA